MASIGVLMLKREQKSRRMRRRQQTRNSPVTPVRKAPKNDWSHRVIHRCMAARIFMEADQVLVGLN